MTRHTPGQSLTDLELVSMLRAVRASLWVLGARAEWRSRRYAVALAAEAAWRGLEV